jgi:hypothetical protein
VCHHLDRRSFNTIFGCSLSAGFFGGGVFDVADEGGGILEDVGSIFEVAVAVARTGCCFDDGRSDIF